MTDKKVLSIAEELRAMSPPDRFRLVADLLERRNAKAAHVIAQFATTELGAALAMHEAGLRTCTPEPRP